MEWTLVPTAKYISRHRAYERRFQRELRAVLTNLESFREALSAGAKVVHVTFGWLHREPMGVKAITEKGGHGKGLKTTRLYVYPDEQAREIHLVTIGDKKTQQDDIKFCNEFVQDLREGKNG